MGIQTVQVYSKADADSRPVELADEAVLIGPPPANRSYLHIPSIIHAALMTGADAVHPGYGFLSEDPDFAEICADNGLTFIGPPPTLVQVMADKAQARAQVAGAGLPVPPGTNRALATLDEACAHARKIGFPVILKAVAGGGGRGMRVVWDADELQEAFTAVRATAQAVFKDDRAYVEKYIPRGRHVEIQVLGDAYGHVVALGDRDCSIQRRQQKLVEESPSCYIDAELRERMSRAAVAAAQAIGYQNAGTFEFIVDPARNFYFLEMNTRIQVEHPVTEMTTGLDLVELMIRVAAGEPLPLKQYDICPVGHAIECRINAEDPTNNWLPASGTITRFTPPGGLGVRVDSHIGAGGTISAFYDSLIAKVITYGKDRKEALNRLRRALREFTCEGVETTLPFHRQLIEHPVFQSGTYDLDFLNRYM